MKQQSGKLGIREYASILILVAGVKAADDTPTAIYSHVQNAAWMMPILSGLLFSIALFLLLKTLSIFPDKNLFEVIQKLLGKYFGFIICLVIFILTSYAISFDTRTYANIIRAFYFTTTPNLIIYAILMFVCAYGANKGIQHIGSVAYLVIFYVLFSFYLVLFISIHDSNLDAIFPIWGTGKLEIMKESFPRLTLFADFFLFTILMPYMTSTKVFHKSIWIAFGVVIFQLVSGILLFICLFDMSLKGVGYPFHSTIRYISFGKFFANIEILFFPIWLLATFIRFSSMLFINSLMFGQIFKIKDFKFLIPSLSVIFLLIGMIPETPVEVSLVIKPKVQYIAGPLFASISILLWLIALLKGEFKHAKNKKSM
jgi:spore germination protein KB